MNMTPTEFFLVLIIAPASAALLAFFFRYKFTSFQKGWEMYEKIKKENQEAFQAKVVKDIEWLKAEMSQKVSFGAHKEVALKVDDYGERIVILEVKVKDIRERSSSRKEGC